MLVAFKVIQDKTANSPGTITAGLALIKAAVFGYVAGMVACYKGFFVKGGDGLADVKPIARLYKGQVYLLARELGLLG